MGRGKKKHMKRLCDENGIISALAFDQRGALKKMMRQYSDRVPDEAMMEQLKTIVAEELSDCASAMLLDPEYGLPASRRLAGDTGLLLAYEKTGYDTSGTERYPDCLDRWSVKKTREQGADGVKFLLYYDCCSSDEVNLRKQAYIERVGAECAGEDIPFFLEILTYDEKIINTSSEEYAFLKPYKVLEAMRTFSDPRFGIDVLKVEVPVNMNYAEGFTDGKIVYSRSEAEEWFRRQSQVSDIPFIYLSAGVSADLFRKTLLFAKEAGAAFSGVLCGRATWAGCVGPFMENGEEAARAWLREEGRNNILELNEVLRESAVPWNKKQ